MPVRGIVPGGVSGQEMCETIVRAKMLKKPDGTHPTADEIWNYSPTGELAMVYLWYEDAKMILASPEAQAIVAKLNEDDSAPKATPEA